MGVRALAERGSWWQVGTEDQCTRNGTRDASRRTWHSQGASPVDHRDRDTLASFVKETQKGPPKKPGL